MRHPARPGTAAEIKNDAYVIYAEWGPMARIPRDERLANAFPTTTQATRDDWIREFRAVEKTIWSLAEIAASLTNESFAQRLREHHAWMEDKAIRCARGRWSYYAIHEGYAGGPNVTLLSDETWKRIRTLFGAEEQGEVVRLLETECGTNLPGLQGSDAHELERYRFAALKLSHGNLDALRDAIELAKTDWRDLLVAAGFADSTTTHRDWDPESPTK